MWNVVWFKRDLRVLDHEPLARAAARGPVLPIHVIEPGLWQQPDASGRHWAFIRESLLALRGELHRHGLPLVVRRGEIVDVLDRLHRKVGIATLSAHQETGNGWTFARDLRVHAWCRAHGIAFEERPAFAVVRRLRHRGAWSAAWEAAMTAPITPLRLAAQPGLPFEPGAIPDWPDPALAHDACEHRQRGGRGEALSLLESFLSGRGRHYMRGMSSPLSAASACSRLSPHLAHGTLGLRELLQRVRRERARLGEDEAVDAFAEHETGDADLAPGSQRTKNPWRRSLASFESRLHWHCHFIQKLESEPGIEFDNVHRGFDGLREGDFNRDFFNAWKSGQTGWPFVDACMRMLVATGWLNFRMRAMLVAVASYHLWLHWREPAHHLARAFTDYEPGIHYPQIQMQSGVTGINIPRIYNPVKQGFDQDPGGAFIRRWLPELRGVKNDWIHTPWLMNASQQRASGCVLGTHYPLPVRDHEQSAREARARYSAWRGQPGMHEQAAAVLDKHGSRKRQPARRSPSKRSAAPPQGDLFASQ